MKTWLARLLGKGNAPVFPVTWERTRPSIYDWLAPYVDSGEILPDSAQTLPDELPVKKGEIRWSAGALDGAMGHHFRSSGDSSSAETIVKALEAVLARPEHENMARLYHLLQGDSPLDYIDALLEIIAEDQRVPAEALCRLVEWLAMKSPDRNVVKFAMALLAFFPTQNSVQILKVLGAHDELTLYAIVALGAILDGDEYERESLALAKRVGGWGRVQLIERLPETVAKATRDWLLREGYVNAVMYEYTAWHCATKGLLVDALKQENDAPLLLGAGEILQALINGGPAQDMQDYPDGAEACQRYLEQMQASFQRDIRHYLAISDICRFASEQQSEEGGWESAQCSELIDRATRLLDRPEWESIIADCLEGEDKYHFNLALSASRLRHSDPWAFIYARQRDNPQDDNWYQLMQTDNPDYVANVITLAEQQLDLQSIASGPDNCMGMGPEYRQHHALDFVLQDLKRFPGMGWSLLEVGLQSPVVRNRHMAINALEVWPTWDDAIAQRIAECLRQEPDEQVRERLSALATVFEAMKG
ncbi:hypothetical protein ACIPR9_16960 [Pectobacterium punjabense]|uniref:hypothetical protein n=1 Tax=Pectobacterium punjabense TaxID=2108399 RepID=UPI00380F137F